MPNYQNKLKIQDLAGKIFVIPYYQRGYRWSENEAKRLFDDLLEFSQSGDPEYCLQPIVLQEIKIDTNWKNFPDSKNKEILRVVDGQQRLTTIAILMNGLKFTWDWSIYYITEQNTLVNLLNSNEDSINQHFREIVKKIFNDYDEDKKQKMRTLFNESSKSISFLRYDIPESQKDEDDEGHATFLRLNDGKTPLTSSELIRALYMVRSSGIPEYEQIEIAKEWEFIENELQQEQFWLMFNSVGLANTPTRIDLIFALVMNVKLEHAKANPRIIFEKMDNPQLDLSAIWQDVLRCFWWMQSCYEDIELFNYLCWVKEFTDISAKSIYDQWLSYPKLEDFKKCIISIIQGKYDGNLALFNYDCDKGDLRKLFVLLNLLDCNHNKERFRFDLYKNASWDIEHIDSRTQNELKDDSSKREWLLSSYNEFKELLKKDEDFKNLENIDKNNISTISLDNFPKQHQRIIDLLTNNTRDNIADSNAIGNLALLNTSINRSYKNAIFPVKRKVIKEFIVTGTCYVPPCTAKAFMKFYTETPSKITYWLKTDFDEYSKQMEKYFLNFMKLPSKPFINNVENTEERYCISNQKTICNTCKNLYSAQKQKHSMEPESFIDFMGKYQVVIPKIQRIYVQGRLDSYGKKCLSSFANHLVDCIIDNKTCILDFIYGIENEGIFYPLDGQQRLTTLLLLAWLCGKTKKTWIFRYESRRATMRFMRELLIHTPPDLILSDKSTKLNELPSCSDIIRKTDWFLPAWEKDAGISGMLKMLDSLYRNLLNSGKKEFDFSQIKFFVNYLDASQASYDHIFLKMNSRGKPLTTWENVKAVLDVNANLGWQKKLNNVWQESLWSKLNASPDKIERLDTKMLSVVELALACAGYDDNDKTNTFKLAKWFEENEGNEFYSISEGFFSLLDNGIKESLEKELTPAWKQQWPDFDKDNSEEFYKPLLAYYYARKSSNPDWIRIVWNIIENAEINKSNFHLAYKLLDELSLHKDAILNFLASDEKIKSTFTADQVKEEREKARQIVNPPRDCKWNCCGPNRWKIQEAEKTAFFKGAIRFLYHNENGEVDWSQFKQKFENSKQYFTEDGVSQSYLDNALLLRRFFTHMNSWDQWWKLKYDSTKDNWHDILLNKNLMAPVHKLLIQNDSKQFDFKSYESKFFNEENGEQKKFLTEFLIKEQVLENLPVGWKLVWRQSWDAGKGVYDLDPRNRGNHPYFIVHPRIKLLSNESIKLDKKGYYIPGVDIDFSYEGHKFRWLITRNSNECEVYLLDEAGEYAKRPTPQGDSVLDKYYCFNIFDSDSMNIDFDSFVNELKKLIGSDK